MYALDASSPSTAWILISTAARMCQSLGYHRLASTGVDQVNKIETKKSLFWYIYILDKTLSLRLGRSSNIHEYDLSSDMRAISKNARLHAWDAMWGLWVETATIHGRVYEQLYSSRALSQSQLVRDMAIQRLATHTTSAQKKNLEVR